jgi:hypothetical protein
LAKKKRVRTRSGEGRRRRSRLDELSEEGGPQEAAAFIAEAVSDLAALARQHKLEMIGFLLGMAQLEAEERVRLRGKRKLS